MRKPTTRRIHTAAVGLLLLSLNQSASSNHNDSDVETNNVHVSKLQEVAHLFMDDAKTKTATKSQHTPPTHFHITSHIQTNLATGVSYFLPVDALANSYANIPFLECGAVGSTTESVPLVSGVFRHVPDVGLVDTKREVPILLDDYVDHDNVEVEGDSVKLPLVGEFEEDVVDAGEKHHPKRPSPPRYVVALSPFEVIVGGNGNQTQVFQAGDVIFMEESWWGIWNENEQDMLNTGDEMKGHIMRAYPDSKQDLNVMVLTVPSSVYRRWKNLHQNALIDKGDADASYEPKSARAASATIRQPWWKLKRHRQTLPKPCSLESDPAFAHPSVASTTLAQHFTQHFVNLLRGFSHPHGSAGFLPHQDLFLPILAQGAAGAIGAVTALGLVLQLWRRVPVQVALGFGAVCVIVLGTWGFVWLGEEILDEWEYWSFRRKLERRWSKRSESKHSNLEEGDEDMVYE